MATALQPEPYTIDEFIELYVPAGHTLDRLCHIRHLGCEPYWRVELLDRRGRQEIGAGKTIEDAFKSARENASDI